MIYDIRHVTTYAYEAPVTHTRCSLRLTPASGPEQRVLSHNVTLHPEPSLRARRRGFFGEEVLTVQIDSPHHELVVEARSRVEVVRGQGEPDLFRASWEGVAAAALAVRSLAPDAPAHFLPPSRLVPLDHGVTAYAAASFPPGRDLVQAATELMQRIRDTFVFDPSATHVATPLGEVFANRRGVCQDFAHVMVAGLRGLGLPAAYVSGYLRTLPPPGQRRLEGADATHAWVALWTGSASGWLHLDPTNAVMIGDDHIVLATGRDYADVAPIDGVVVSAGSQRLTVAVDVVPRLAKAGDVPALRAQMRT